MRAVLMAAHGGLDVLSLGELPDPQPAPGEVVVDIHAASVNGADFKVRTGDLHYEGMTFPHVLGRDFSGVVSAVGDGADLNVGEEVFAVCIRGRDGGYAEKIAIPGAIVARKPAGLDHCEAAAMALVGITAIAGIETVGQVEPGQRVLVQGGAGGVAGLAIQLAKHLGAAVTSTASAANHGYVRALGADEVIDYNTTDFTEVGQYYDLVYDTVGGEVQRRSASVVKPGGKLVYCAPGPEELSPSRTDIAVLKPPVDRGRDKLDRITELVAAGALRPPAITRFPLADAVEAHRLSEGRHLRGKLVLVVR